MSAQVAKAPVAKQTGAAGKGTPSAKKLTFDLPKTEAEAVKEAARLRGELAESKRKHALQKLDTPGTLRTLRRQLARVLTVQHALAASAKAASKAAPTKETKS